MTVPYITSSSSAYSYILTPTVSSSSAVSAPRPQTAMEWLDAEIEATCKLARQAS
jgi:hypothetical protein